MPFPPLNGLRAFEAAARSGSYVKAAQELNVSPSAISRLVKLLEARVGVALFARRPNGLVLTERGAAYLAELTAAFAKIAQATERLRARTAEALVVGAGPTLAMRWLIPRLPAFHAAYPDIDVRLSTSIAGAEPMKADWHAAIRLGDGDWPGLKAEFLFTAALFPVCAPALLPSLPSPSDLARSTLLSAANAAADWPLWAAAAGVSDSLDLRRSVMFDYPAFALQAAIDGLGVAMARGPFVADDLSAGRLVKPFALSVPNGKGWWFIHRPELEDNAALNAFRTWVIAAAVS
jgi:LysR family glycine cleavage system transcriptional activator/LysR family transcriptional regulator of beta-lactamase